MLIPYKARGHTEITTEMVMNLETNVIEIYSQYEVCIEEIIKELGARHITTPLDEGRPHEVQKLQRNHCRVQC